MSFLYPRLIDVLRPNVAPASQVGEQPYNADRGAVDETVVATGLRASIQFDRAGQINPQGLPTDVKQASWRILIPAADAELGTILVGDVIVDETGQRYSVNGPEWQGLGYAVRVMSLEV